MNLLDKWFRKMMRKVEQEDCTIDAPESRPSYSGLRGGQVMKFTIYKASGGFVIQYTNEDNDPNNYKSYNAVPTSNNNEPKLLIVNNGEDLGKAIDQLILVEALKA